MSTTHSDSRTQSQFQFAGGGAKSLAERSAAKQRVQREKIDEMHSGLRDTLPALKKLPASVRSYFNSYMGLIGGCAVFSTVMCVISCLECRSVLGDFSSAQMDLSTEVRDLKKSISDMSAAAKATQASMLKYKADDGSFYVVKDSIVIEGRDGRKFFEVQKTK